MSILHLKDIYRRRCAGDYWHSRSRGESIFGIEDPRRDFIIEIVAALVLWFVSPFFAGFFVLSRWMGYAAEAAALLGHLLALHLPRPLRSVKLIAALAR